LPGRCSTSQVPCDARTLGDLLDRGKRADIRHGAEVGVKGDGFDAENEALSVPAALLSAHLEDPSFAAPERFTAALPLRSVRHISRRRTLPLWLLRVEEDVHVLKPEACPAPLRAEGLILSPFWDGFSA
jgi:hypothetical protein